MIDHFHDEHGCTTTFELPSNGVPEWDAPVQRVCLIASFIPIPWILEILRSARIYLPSWFVSGYYGLSQLVLGLFA